MKKSEACYFFGGTQANLARALGITAQAVGQWPDELTQAQEDRVMGAILRLGKLPQLFAVRMHGECEP